MFILQHRNLSKDFVNYGDEKDMLLLFDEVQTGWGRTGAPMAYMGYGVKPDAVSMAKAVGGGMPLAACCATEKVAKAFTAGTHGSTYGGHLCNMCSRILHSSNKRFLITT